MRVRESTPPPPPPPEPFVLRPTFLQFLESASRGGGLSERVPAWPNRGRSRWREGPPS